MQPLILQQFQLQIKISFSQFNCINHGNEGKMFYLFIYLFIEDISGYAKEKKKKNDDK